MKKIFVFLFLILSMLIGTRPNVVIAEGFARAYIVVESTSGKVLEGKDIKRRQSVASISKIMTAIIALESDKLFLSVTVGDEIDKVVGSSLYLKKDSKINIIDLVYGLMLRSGNDAAMIIAKNVGGSIETFVDMMNDKATNLGMKDSTFSNPHGLDIDDDGNVSSPYDMALLMRYCLKNELFKEISSTKKYNSPFGVWVNKHKLLQGYEYVTGGKTGYTKKARRTLVTSARKDDLELIVVTFDCGSDFSMHKSIFEKYFKDYIGLKYLDKGINYIHGYEINSLEEVILMIKKEDLKGGLMVYQINIDSNKLLMSFINKDNEETIVKCMEIPSFSLGDNR